MQEWRVLWENLLGLKPKLCSFESKLLHLFLASITMLLSFASTGWKGRHLGFSEKNIFGYLEQYYDVVLVLYIGKILLNYSFFRKKYSSVIAAVIVKIKEIFELYQRIRATSAMPVIFET